MKKGRFLVVTIALLGSLFAPFFIFGEAKTEDLQSWVIERFDVPDGAAQPEANGFRDNHRWIVRGSKFVTEGYPQVSWVRTWPNALYRQEPADVELRSLGVRAAFDRLGYNYLEYIPVEDEDGENGPIPKGIAIPGRVKNIDLWVWGSNFDYYVDLHLRDYRGIVHVLRLGDINYRGWRNLFVNIPAHIPQSVVYVPQRTGLELIKMVLWTRPDEQVEDFYVYFDHIKVFTDMFEEPFDGELLSNPEVIEQLWNEEQGR